MSAADSKDPASAGQTAVEAEFRRGGEAGLGNGFRDLQRQLLQHAERVRCNAGEIIFRRGETGQAFFLIGRGRVRISVPGARGERTVTDLGPGEYFGEMALLTGEPRSATAVAVTPTLLHKVTREAFWLLLNSSPALALEITRYLSRRLRARTLDKAAQVGRVVVLLATRPTEAEAAFAVQFALTVAGLDGTGVALLDTGAAGLVAQLPEDNPAAKLLTRVDSLGTATADADVLVAYSRLVVRTHLSSTSCRFWLQEADVVVALDLPEMPAPTLPVLGDSCRAFFREVHREHTGASCETHAQPLPLVRLHREAGRSEPAELRRFVRRVLGRRVGLALSAGGAKGLAHLGAVQVLEQAGVEFDLIAGTSMGGVVGGLLAMGQDCDTLTARFALLAKNFRRLLLDFGVPRIALLRGAKKRSLIEAHTGDLQIEQLPIVFATVAADLVSGREKVFSSGSLALALDATTAIPMIFPPVYAQGCAYVDGWVVNPLPTDLLRRLGADIVIAVDTSIQAPVSAAQYGDDRTAAGRGGLWRTNPAIASIAIRALEVSARERSLASLASADAGITPNVDMFSPTDFRPLADIVACGAEAAEAALPEVRAALRGRVERRA